MNFREVFHDLNSLATEQAEIQEKCCEEAIYIKAKSLSENMVLIKTIRERKRDERSENSLEMLVLPQEVKFLALSINAIKLTN